MRFKFQKEYKVAHQMLLCWTRDFWGLRRQKLFQHKSLSSVLTLTQYFVIFGRIFLTNCFRHGGAKAAEYVLIGRQFSKLVEVAKDVLAFDKYLNRFCQIPYEFTKSFVDCHVDS